MVSGLARCSFALRPAGSLTRFRAFCTKAFEHFIAAMLASAATGWSVSCRVGLFTLPLEFCAFPRRTQTGSKPGVSDSLYPRIMRNTRDGEERTRQDHGQSNQIQLNRTGSRPIETDQGQFQIKAQAAGSRLARTSLDFGRARWMQRSSERMNGNANCLSDRNTYYIYDTDEHGSGLAENLRLSSLIFAYSRLFSLNGRKMFERRL
jgi:hypothetical protein